MAVDFMCRLCGSREFFSVRAHLYTSSHWADAEPRLFICRGCSVVFRDPQKFSDPCTLSVALEPEDVPDQEQLELSSYG